MANEQNLTHYTSETAAEGGRKGGTAKSDVKTWRNQKYCNKKCVFADRCPAISTSKGQLAINGKYPCFIKAQPQEVQNYFKSLFSEGEEGLIKVIMDLHFRLMLKTQSAKISSKELREALEASLNMKKGIYGDRSKIEIEGHVRIIQAPELRKILKEIDGNKSNTDIRDA